MTVERDKIGENLLKMGIKVTSDELREKMHAIMKDCYLNGWNDAIEEMQRVIDEMKTK